MMLRACPWRALLPALALTLVAATGCREAAENIFRYSTDASSRARSMPPARNTSGQMLELLQEEGVEEGGRFLVEVDDAQVWEGNVGEGKGKGASAPLLFKEASEPEGMGPEMG